MLNHATFPRSAIGPVFQKLLSYLLDLTISQAYFGQTNILYKNREAVAYSLYHTDVKSNY